MICPRCHRRFEHDHAFCPQDGERLVDIPDIKRIRSKPTEHAGTILGKRYQIRGQLGKGAMAQVFLAFDKTTSEPVALKVLEAKHLQEPRTRARFLNEARAAAQIGHPGIVKVLDVGLRDDGAPYLVSEFLFGETLGEWLRRERVMSVPKGIPVLRQIAEALGAAHDAGIIHRDIKPDNVMLVGEKGHHHTLKVVDFGFAKIIGEKINLTQAGMTVGTIEYMAPEQAVSDPADVRTDVYALGVLAYRLFAGRLPFHAPGDPEMLAHNLITPAPPLSLGGSELAPGLEAVVLRMLRKAPDNRYHAMSALLEDLDRLERGSPPSLARVPPVLPDVYSPKTPFAITAAKFLYKKLDHNPSVV